MRVLLVFDEYQEMMVTETYLKKVGFDVIGIMNELSIQEKIFEFNPEAIIVSGKSNRVSSISVGKKLKDILRYDGRVVLALPKNQRPDPDELRKIKMDVLMESPIQSDRLIQVLAKFSGVSAEPILEKLKKARLSDPDLNQKMTMISGRPSEKQINPKDSRRAQIYEQFIQQTQIDVKQTSFEKAELVKRQKELKKTWDFGILEEIDQLKRQFASALFKKKE